jgi:hypothetical protein
LTTAIAVKSNVDPKERYQLRTHKVSFNNMNKLQNEL